MYRIKARFITDKTNLSKNYYEYNMPDEIFEDIATSDMFYPYDDGSGGDMPAYRFTTELHGKRNSYNASIVITDIDKINKALKDRPTILELKDDGYFDIKNWDCLPEEAEPLKDTLINLDSCLTSPAWFDDVVDFHIEVRKKEEEMTPEQSISTLKISPLKVEDLNPNSLYITADDGLVNVCNSISATNKAASLATSELQSLRTELENMKKKEEEKGMKFNSITKDFRFGKVNDVRISIYGPAFNSCNNGIEWLAYDKANEDWVDVSPFNFDVKFPVFYMMPVAKDKVATGDFIMHCNSWVRIVDFDDALRPIAEDPWKKEIITIMPTKNMFGFDFYTKLVNVFGDFAGQASKENPFGNMLPFMMMSDGGKMEDMLPMLMMMGGQFDMSNPMMLMAMCGDGKMSDMLPLMMMMNMNKEVKKNED